MQDFLALVQKFDKRADATFIAEVDFFAFFAAFVRQHDADAAVQEGLFSEPCQQRVVVKDGFFEDFGVGLEGDFCAARLAFADLFQREAGDAALVPLHHDVFSVEIGFDFEPLGQRVDDAGADAVQTAGDFIPAAAEFAACMQDGINDFNGGDVEFCIFAGRNAAAVVGDADDVARQDRDGNRIAGAGKRFVNGVVDDFINEMMKSAHGGRTDVHAGPLPDGLQALQNLYLILVVSFDHRYLRFSVGNFRKKRWMR